MYTTQRRSSLVIATVTAAASSTTFVPILRSCSILVTVSPFSSLSSPSNLSSPSSLSSWRYRSPAEVAAATTKEHNRSNHSQSSSSSFFSSMATSTTTVVDSAAQESKAYPKLTLYYLPVRARAEAARMLLAYARVPYNNVIVSRAEWPEFREALGTKIPFGQLPLLVINDETHIAQSGSICRYLGTLTGVIPADPIEAAKADQVFEYFQEMTTLNPVANVAVGPAFVEKKAAAFETVPRHLKYLALILGDKPFCMGDKPTHADFMAYHIFDLILALEPSTLADYPMLVAWYKRVGELPGVAEYLASRAPLRELPTVA